MAAAKTRVTEKMYKLIAILLLATCLAGCKTPKPIVQTVVKDSVVIRDTTIYRNSIKYLPGEAVEMWKTVPCPDVRLDTTIKNGHVILTASIIKGILKMRCNTDSLMHVIDSIIQLKNKEVYRTQRVEVPVDKRVPYIPRWVWLLIAGNVVVVGYKYRKLIIGYITKI